VQSWDCAFKDTDGSDYVVGQVWGFKGADKYLLDQDRRRLSFSATVQAIRALSAKWPKASAKLVEDRANGSAVIDTLRHEVSGLIAVDPEGGKEARAHAVSPFVEAHNVYLPQRASWVDGFVEECAAFPHGAHDDQVDAMSQALTWNQRHSHGLLMLWKQQAEQIKLGGGSSESAVAQMNFASHRVFGANRSQVPVNKVEASTVTVPQTVKCSRCASPAVTVGTESIHCNQCLHTEPRQRNGGRP
jgi:predicted phage terminase large subunit-like protein